MRRPVTLFLLAALVVALAVAVFASPFASSQPDGLNKVAIEEGFDGTARDHALDDGPVARYGVRGVEGERTGKALAGFIGVLATLAVGLAGFAGLRIAARRRAPAPARTAARR